MLLYTPGVWVRWEALQVRILCSVPQSVEPCWLRFYVRWNGSAPVSGVVDCAVDVPIQYRFHVWVVHPCLRG